MKKTICIFSIVLCALTLNCTFGQTLRIKGTYKNKPIEIEYQEGGPGRDYVSKIVYEPYNRLQSEVNGLTNDKNKLVKEKKNLEKEINRLEKIIGDGPTPDTAIISELKGKISSLQDSLSNKEREIERKENEADSLLRDALAELQAEKKISADLRERLKESPQYATNRDNISIGYEVSVSSIKNTLTSQDFWNNELSMSNGFLIKYCHYFSKLTATALYFGVEYEQYGFKSSIQMFEENINGIVDPDGDVFNRNTVYKDIREKVNLSYIGIPVGVHIGNNKAGGGVQPWFEAGIILLMNMSANFDGSGKYTSTAYYPKWDMTVHDVEVLGLRSNAVAYDDDTKFEMKKMVLSGAVSIGMYVPFSSQLALNTGIHCGYTLTSVANPQDYNEKEGVMYHLGQSNLLGGEGTRIFSYGLSAALVYKF